MLQYAITVYLNYKEIKKHDKRLRKIKSFLNKYLGITGKK